MSRLSWISRVTRTTVTVLALASLAQCAAASPGVPPAATQFDGLYVGQSTLVRGWGYVCGAPSYPLQIPVLQGRFVYPIQVPPYGNPPVVVQLRADGSLSAAVLYTAETYLPPGGPGFRYAWINVAGRVAGPTLDATVVDLRCARRVTLTLQRS
jgi:hypothetical protein